MQVDYAMGDQESPLSLPSQQVHFVWNNNSTGKLFIMFSLVRGMVFGITGNLFESVRRRCLFQADIDNTS